MVSWESRLGLKPWCLTHMAQFPAKTAVHKAALSPQASPPFCRAWTIHINESWDIKSWKSCKISASAPSHTLNWVSEGNGNADEAGSFKQKWSDIPKNRHHSCLVINVSAFRSTHSFGEYPGHQGITLFQTPRGTVMLKPGDGESHKEEASLNNPGFSLY